MQTVQPTFFKLKSARDYRFYNRLGQSMLVMKLGVPLTVRDPADVEYFRSRPDVVIETDEAGVPLDELAKRGYLEPQKTKSFEVYGKRLKTSPSRIPAPIPVSASRQEVETYKPRSEPNLGKVVEISTPSPRESVSPIEEAAPDGTTRVVTAPPI